MVHFSPDCLLQSGVLINFCPDLEIYENKILWHYLGIDLRIVIPDITRLSGF
jgi:hypothetical protein